MKNWSIYLDGLWLWIVSDSYLSWMLLGPLEVISEKKHAKQQISDGKEVLGKDPLMEVGLLLWWRPLMVLGLMSHDGWRTGKQFARVLVV